MNQNNAYLANSFVTAGKTLVLCIGQKGLFLQIWTFRIFFSASIECQPAILVHCIDQSKRNLQKMVSCLCDLLFSLSYCHKESTLWDTIPKLVLLPWQQDTQTSLCLSSFIATSVMMLVLSNLVAFSSQRSFWLSSPLKDTWPQKKGNWGI